MARDNTHYTVIQGEPDLADELQELDWSNGNAVVKMVDFSYKLPSSIPKDAV